MAASTFEALRHNFPHFTGQETDPEKVSDSLMGTSEQMTSEQAAFGLGPFALSQRGCSLPAGLALPGTQTVLRKHLPKCPHSCDLPDSLKASRRWPWRQLAGPEAPGAGSPPTGSLGWPGARLHWMQNGGGLLCKALPPPLRRHPQTKHAEKAARLGWGRRPVPCGAELGLPPKD